MAKDLHRLPFKVGQEAESKSFSPGFRAAWFRCKIKNISTQKGQIGYSLEFFDFPDEKVTWTKVYQKPPQHSKSDRENKVELMVRPSFPPYFRESKRPDSYPACDVVAIVADDWEVGDLVDWWSDGCFWSGRITRLVGNNKVQIELPEPPIGEGQSYEALCKDLRPSLNWSLEHGWTVPISREYGSSQYCVRLVQPLQDEEAEEDAFGKNITEENERPLYLKFDGIIEEKSCCEPSNSHDGRKGSSNITRMVLSRASRYGSSNFQERVWNFQERVWSGESNFMTSKRHHDTVESAIMELEEVANKIRWLKGLLRFGFRWSNAMKPSWKLLENSGPHIKRTYRGIQSDHGPC